MNKLLLGLKHSGVKKFKLLNCIESIFNKTDMGFDFVNQDTLDFNVYVKQVLQDQFIQKWHHHMQLSTRGQFYSSFKNSFAWKRTCI